MSRTAGLTTAGSSDKSRTSCLDQYHYNLEAVDPPRTALVEREILEAASTNSSRRSSTITSEGRSPALDTEPPTPDTSSPVNISRLSLNKPLPVPPIPANLQQTFQNRASRPSRKPNFERRDTLVGGESSGDPITTGYHHHHPAEALHLLQNQVHSTTARSERRATTLWDPGQDSGGGGGGRPTTSPTAIAAAAVVVAAGASPPPPQPQQPPPPSPQQQQQQQPAVEHRRFRARVGSVLKKLFLRDEVDASGFERIEVRHWSD